MCKENTGSLRPAVLTLKICYNTVMKILSKIFPTEDEKAIKRISKTVDSILEREEALKLLTDEELKAKSLALRDDVRARIDNLNTEVKIDQIKNKIAIEKIVNDVAAEAFALVREAARRALGMMHYRVQLIGGMMIHNGNIAEMRTGEGKTLVATLPAYLNALAGRGVHIVTVNDYLSRRDAVWMGEIYNRLGLITAVINNESSYIYDEAHKSEIDDVRRDRKAEYKVAYDYLRPITRREAYQADITYGTNSEFGFDYLRDNLVYENGEMVQRGHYYAIVDEIDSILIDEARTPLIISNATHDSGNIYNVFANIAKSMDAKVDYIVDEKEKAVQITDVGITKAEGKLKVPSLYTTENVRLVHHLETALRAKSLFIKEKQYIISNGEIIIVDEFTGHKQPGRRWSDGLHQAVEAKEGVEIQKESRTVASITYQNYFRFYKKLSGMSGTAKTSEEEFYKVYGLPVTTIPTHNEINRTDNTDLIFQSEKGKWKAIATKVKELHEKGQPVLIGTVSIENNEVMSRYLDHAKVPHQVLNAKNHEREGEIIANAGKRGSVTVATNMAGRGVDIKLGGAGATDAEREEIVNLGGLFVIGTERHEARRIDNQLRGRSGRQGDRGETQFYVSLEDDLMRVFGSDRIKNMMGKFGIPEEEAIKSSIVSRSLENAQEKIEGFHFDSRKHTLQYDDVLNQQRKSIYEKRTKVLDNDKDFMDELLAKVDNQEIVKEKKDKYNDYFYTVVRSVLLQIYDVIWMDHLEQMEYLRSNVNLRAYGQRDPLIEYKKEGLRMYRELDNRALRDLGHFITHVDGVVAQLIARDKKSEKKNEEAIETKNRN